MAEEEDRLVTSGELNQSLAGIQTALDQSNQNFSAQIQALIAALANIGTQGPPGPPGPTGPTGPPGSGVTSISGANGLTGGPITTSGTLTFDTTAAFFTPPGTGSVSTALSNQFRNYVTAAQFGATGDGSTNDRAALQSFLNYLALSPYMAGWLVGSSGNQFVITGSVPLTFGNYTTLYCFGGNTTLTNNQNCSALQSVNKNSGNTYGLNIIGGLRIDCVSPVTYPNGVGIDLTTCKDCRINNVYVFNAETGFLLQDTSGLIIGSYYNRLEGCVAVSCTYGFLNGTLGNENTYIGCRTLDCANAGFRSDGNGVTWVGGGMERSGGGTAARGIDVEPGSITLNIFGCRIEGMQTDGIRVQGGATYTNLFGVYFSSNSTNLSDAGTGTTTYGTHP